MKKIKISPRENYSNSVEELGLTFHEDYWKEDSYYEFREFEIDILEKATKECYDMYCEAVQYVINNDLWDKIKIPRECVPAIIKSWNEDDLSLYGRFDFVFKNGDPKLLEFNADTPTTLIEGSIIQWHWKEELFKESCQFNSIHEGLIQSFVEIHEVYKSDLYHFACIRTEEDHQTIKYILSCAMEAGLNVVDIEMEQLLFEDGKCYDPSDKRVTHCFKLYPFEWMMNECPEDVCSDIIWIEPLWKSVMSNKALLPIIYELFPNSPYILKSYFENENILREYCKKPIFSREGSNVSLVSYNSIIESSDGEYGEEGYICQELVELESFDGNYPILGCWVIGGEPGGMSIRESESKITNNMAKFIPHIFN